MNLSNLVFNAVKNVKYLEDSNFSYDGFIRGEFDNDMDYANSINNVFAPLNEAIHRLSDMNKISFKVERLPSPSSNGLIDIRSISYDIKTKEVKSGDGYFDGQVIDQSLPSGKRLDLISGSITITVAKVTQEDVSEPDVEEDDSSANDIIDTPSVDVPKEDNTNSGESGNGTESDSSTPENTDTENTN